MLEDLISADGFIFTNEIEKKLHKEKPVSRKHVIMMTVKSVDKFRDKAHVLLCMMVSAFSNINATIGINKLSLSSLAKQTRNNL